MSAPATAEVEIRPLVSFEHLDRCVEIQIAVWAYSDQDLVPRRMFVLAQQIGGQVIGAVAGDRVVGFAMALPGVRDGHSYLHSHMLAVLPEFRNSGLGRRLKLAQRDDALVRGFDLMQWTFDPLEIKNSYFNLVRLGAISRRYQADFYGPSSSPLQGDLPTDRLRAEWWLRSDRVERLLDGHAVPALGDKVAERVVVPQEIYAWRRDPNASKRARDVQRSVRGALETAFANGFAIIGFSRQADGSGAFLLGSPPADACTRPKEAT